MACKLAFIFLLGISLHFIAAPRSAESAIAGRIVVVKNSDDFGIFLPPKPKQQISDHEGDSVAFCTQPTDRDASCQPFPHNFIQSANFKATDKFVQVTGLINGDIYTSIDDEGGQYDHHNSPQGGRCAGHRFFVNLVEPAEGRYCIRCCSEEEDCPTGNSEAGCPSVIPGRYS